MDSLLPKFAKISPLTGGEKTALYRLLSKYIRHVPARKEFICEGDTPAFVYVLLSGWACRYRLLKDGNRQIISLFLPGDLCNHGTIFAQHSLSYSVGAITPIVLARAHRDEILALAHECPRVMHALWRDALFSMAAHDEWIVSLGSKSAFERIAHFFCEIYVRQDSLGLTRNGACRMPLTQADLGDVTGLSIVHVNRILKLLHSAKLIELKGKDLTIPDFNALAQTCSFSPEYLSSKGACGAAERYKAPGPRERVAK